MKSISAGCLQVLCLSLSIPNREAALSRIMFQDVQRYFHKHRNDLVTSKKNEIGFIVREIY
jgi:hypothetical protein